VSKGPFPQRFVAFVDILGFRDLVARMSRDEHLFKSVRDALKDLDAQTRNFRAYRRRKRTKGVANLVPKTNLQMTAFSDCYVLSETFPAWHVVAAVQALGSRFLRDGILTRGAVVKGPTYHNGRVLFGPGIIDAYGLESSLAFYPRIIVSEEVVNDVWGYHEGVWGGRLLQRDHDGWWFVNLLVPSRSSWHLLSDPNGPQDVRSHLEQVRHALLSAQKRARGDAAHLAKVTWLVDQYNDVAPQENLRRMLFDV
jgi:hypothetical protein